MSWLTHTTSYKLHCAQRFTSTRCLAHDVTLFDVMTKFLRLRVFTNVENFHTHTRIPSPANTSSTISNSLSTLQSTNGHLQSGHCVMLLLLHTLWQSTPQHLDVLLHLVCNLLITCHMEAPTAADGTSDTNAPNHRNNELGEHSRGSS